MLLLLWLRVDILEIRKSILYVAVTTSQMISLKTKILRVDPKAFITIIDVSEVKGKGFATI